MTQPNYAEMPFRKEMLLPEPTEQFHLWFEQAKSHGEIEPSAMTLATVDKSYQVSARMVLLKSFDKDGFIFFTNYLSPKAKALAEIPQAALVFWWPLCQRQVRITGTVTLLEKEHSVAYFQQRSKDSQIAALISQQSAIIPDREYLLKAFEKAAAQYSQQTVLDCPDFWGGYRLHHQSMEFWQGRAHRLHDRFEYRRSAQGWQVVQLSP